MVHVDYSYIFAHCNQIPLCIQSARPFQHLSGTSCTMVKSALRNAFPSTILYKCPYKTKFDVHKCCCHWQGVLFSTPACLKAPIDFVRLWLHEASRVYGDKFIEEKDMETFAKLKNDVVKTSFEV